jgi:hypothetical protein
MARWGGQDRTVWPSVWLRWPRVAGLVCSAADVLAAVGGRFVVDTAKWVTHTFGSYFHLDATAEGM